MARVIATDLDGELSLNGSLTNPLFARSGNRAQVGDVGTVTVKVDTVGWEARNLTVRCSPGISLSLNGTVWGANGASLYLGTVTSAGTAVYVKAVAASSTVASLLIDQSTLVFVAVVDVTVPADLLTATTAIQSPVVTGTANVAADLLTLTVDSPAVSVDLAGSVSVSADALSLTAALFDPSIVVDASIAPDALSLTSAAQEVTVVTDDALSFEVAVAEFSTAALSSLYQRFSIYYVDAAGTTIATLATNQSGYNWTGSQGGSNPTVSTTASIMESATYKVKVVREFSGTADFASIYSTQTTTSDFIPGYAILEGSAAFGGCGTSKPSSAIIAASGTITIPYTTTEQFSGSTLPASFTAYTAGSGAVSVADGAVTCSEPSSTSDAAFIVRNAPLIKGRNYKWRVKASSVGTTSGTNSALWLLLTGTIAADTSTNVSTNNLCGFGYLVDDTDTSPYVFLRFAGRDTSNASKYWRPSDSTWGTAETSPSAAEDTYYWVTMETTSTQWRVTVTDATDATTVLQTAWRNWSDTRSANTEYRIGMGDPYTTNTQTTVTVDEWREW